VDCRTRAPGWFLQRCRACVLSGTKQPYGLANLNKNNAYRTDDD
jgi:hypothetical protein